MSTHTPKTILIEGSIGVGKTTFLETLRFHNEFTEQKIQVVDEPLNLWENLSGYNLLSLYGQYPHRYGFAFQSYVILTMMQRNRIKLEFDKTIRVIERSIYSAKYVFTEYLKQNQDINNIEYNILQQWFNLAIEGEPDVKPDVIIYLKASPETLYRRIRERGRQGEQFITLDQLRKLGKLYDDWLGGGIDHKDGVLTRMIDTDHPFIELESDLIDCCEFVVNICNDLNE